MIAVIIGIILAVIITFFVYRHVIKCTYLDEQDITEEEILFVYGEEDH
ncbi:MAG: hypothetical protein JXQ82_10750 [Methanomicrobiaceae archaeon]|nr:hypothetical protein [Methanomicrobiaceae archaeon]